MNRTETIIQQILFSTQDSQGRPVIGDVARAKQIARTLKEKDELRPQGRMLLEATELDLMTQWLKLRRERGDKLLTRSAEAEVRHVCLYASQQLAELRTVVINPDVLHGHVVIELHDVITDLEGLIAYLETGKGGGFSALDRRKSEHLEPG